MFMKKTIFIILWMITFWIAAIIVWSVGVALFAHPSQAMSWSDEKTRVIMFLDQLGFYGFPVLALILGIFGKLPGTRSRKDLVQT
jgi:hypothetical protein